MTKIHYLAIFAIAFVVSIAYVKSDSSQVGETKSAISEKVKERQALLDSL